jgi:hypothetical protein
MSIKKELRRRVSSKGVSAGTQHLAVKFKEQNLGIKFYHKVLRNAVHIVEKWLKVFIVKRAEGADWVLKVPRC